MSPLGRPNEDEGPKPPRPPIRPPESERRPPRPETPAPPPPPAPAAPAPAAARLPERMRANKAIAGHACPACNVALALGDDAWNCQACGTPHHAPCRDQAGQCMADGCSSAAQEAVPVEGAEMKACPYCGEQILKAAKKCKHCKEVLSPALRASRDRAAKSSPDRPGKTGLICAIVGLFICGPILGTVAIVYGIQARKKDVDAGMGTAAIIIGILDLLIFVGVILANLAGE
jgi:predicted RNA-binding Zn-ribbon protein involved in translation (DUF1610 family)